MFATQLAAVRKHGEDHEWYPTTTEIITAMTKSLKQELRESYHRVTVNFLDIGAGNGKVLDAVRDLNDKSEHRLIDKFFAIEKSHTLLDLLPPHVFILGVDFWNTSLIDKEIDVIFCNPPYSMYQEWTDKILQEARAGTLIYLVVPERWEKSAALRTTITTRQATEKILGSFDFLNAEDRKARAKVHLLKIQIGGESRRNRRDYHDDSPAPEDPFERFFNATFKFSEEKEEKPFEEQLRDTQLVSRVNFIEALDILYTARLAELHRNYAAVCAIDAGILKEFDIFKHGLIASLRMKMTTAKKEYWQRLFDGMKEITHRLTVGSRKSILALMQENTGIDFNRDNAYAVVMWVVKNANTYFDSQLIATYEKMVEHANVENYVSNKRIFKRDRFRYDYAQNKLDESTHYRLKVGHRMVLNHCGGLEKDWSRRGISERATDFLCDLMTVARNLGFHVQHNNPYYHQWNDSSAREFIFTNERSEHEVLFRVRAFQNSNMHMQFHPDFIHALNVQHGKLKGWLRNDDEAAVELEIPAAIARRHFTTTYRITGSSLSLMNAPQDAPLEWIQTEIFAA